MESVLSPGELGLWWRMCAADRRHAVAVGRRAAPLLDAAGRSDRAALAAALLHDVGKVEAGLGTLGRVGATLAGLAGAGRRARTLGRRGGLAGRVGRYLDHSAIGAEMLAAAGSDPLTVTWAYEHHLTPEDWTLPSPVAAALHRADDD